MHMTTYERLFHKCREAEVRQWIMLGSGTGFRGIVREFSEVGQNRRGRASWGLADEKRCFSGVRRNSE